MAETECFNDGNKVFQRQKQSVSIIGTNQGHNYLEISQEFCIFASSNHTTMTKEEIFRKKAPHYLVCFIDQCPLHENCLRWLVGCEAPTDTLMLPSVNPRHPETGTEQCPHYRQEQYVNMARGMMNFYDNMPGRTERAIKHRLISMFSRKTYYDYRKGVRLIPPDIQAQIEQVCQEEGWTGELNYDGWEKEILW